MLIMDSPRLSEETRLHVSIIIPVGREGFSVYRRIAEFYESVEKLFGKHGFSCEIIAVTDIYDTEVFKALVRLSTRRNFKSMFLTVRVGKGGSIRNALQCSEGEVAVFLDADFPITPKQLIETLSLLEKENVELVVAFRKRRHSVLRKTLSTIYNAAVNIVFKTGIRDHQVGIKVLRRKALKILSKETVSNVFAYDTELVVKAKRKKLKIVEVPITPRKPTRKSTISLVKTALILALELLIVAASWKYSIERRIIGESIIISQGKLLVKHEYENYLERSLLAKFLSKIVKIVLKTT